MAAVVVFLDINVCRAAIEAGRPIEEVAALFVIAAMPLVLLLYFAAGYDLRRGG